MKTFYKILIILLVIQAGQLNAQVIRKNYREMTSAERQIFVDALYDIGGSSGTSGSVNSYATNHADLFFTTIHGNTGPNNDFLPWHRWFILHFEKALQNANVTGAEKIALPYWDWTSKYYLTTPTDQEKNSPLFNESGDFLGLFESDWNLDRDNTTTEDLAIPSDLEGLLLGTNFATFRQNIEFDPFHNVGHRWVGGQMIQLASPKDPVFYLHHNMVDKIWQDWQNLGRTSSFGSDVLMPNTTPSGIPRFPTGVSHINPTVIIDSRASEVKVWFAENGKVILDKYTVSGTENYFYTGIIEVGSRVITSVVLNTTSVNYSTGNFIVPSGTTCKMVSGGLQMGTAPSKGIIKLVPGFTVQSGANFTAKIDEDYFTDPSAGARTRDLFPAETLDLYTVFPNPSNGLFKIDFSESNEERHLVSVINSFGIEVAQSKSTDKIVEMNLQSVPKGMYTVIIKTNSGKTVQRKILIH
jgi:tyrosinase